MARKPFSVERRRVGLDGNGLGGAPHFDLPSFGGGAEESDGPDAASLTEEIRALREEVRTLREEVTGQALSAPPKAESGATAAHNPNDDIRTVQIEIAQMVKMIGKAKSELAAIKHPKAEDDRIVSASNELDAIVMATESATNSILSATETVEREMMNLAALCHDDSDVVEATERVASTLTEVMEACNFQDITGQRITKVVNTMRFIEERIVAMINIWGVEAFAEVPIPNSPSAEDDNVNDEDLLNGPQLGGQGLSQADIDALFD